MLKHVNAIDILTTFIAAMTPIGELRLAIPLAIYAREVPWYLALPVAILGNMVPVLVLVPSLNRISRVLLSFRNPAGSLLRWQTKRLQTTHSLRFQRYGAMALIILVAIPLPMTGAWTGSLAASVFQIPQIQAIILIGLGVFIAGVIVTILTLSGIEIGSMTLGG
jgi:uncharacterized membrane protein